MNARHFNTGCRALLTGALLLLGLQTGRGAGNQILGWNNLGMHCMDSDYSVFSVLPPYNTIEAQLIVNGPLVTNGAGYTVTYQAVADPAGSFNSTAMGKGNYYNYAPRFTAPSLAPEAGFGRLVMPGTTIPPKPCCSSKPTSRPPESSRRSIGFEPRAFPSRPTTMPQQKIRIR